MSRRFVFLDPAGKRWPRLRRALFALGLLAFAGFVWFAHAIFVKPELRLPPSVRQLKGQLKALRDRQPASPAPKADWRKYPAPPAAPAKPHPAQPLRPDQIREIRLGFCSPWDPASVRSLRGHAGQLTHVAFDWASLVDAGGTLRVDPEVDPRRLLAEGGGLPLMPLLDNLAGDDWQPEAVENLAAGPPARRAGFIADLRGRLGAVGAAGVICDFEQLDPSLRDELTALLAEVAAGLHDDGRELWLVLPLGDELTAFDLDALAASIDRFVALLFDETADDDPPGPIASQDWIEGWAAVLARYGAPGRWLAALGTHAYDWTDGKTRAETISFADAMERASYGGIDRVELAAPTYNPSFSYSDPAGEHTVWFLDAITLLNQTRAARAAGFGGIAIHRLGTEDPRLWDALAVPEGAALAAATRQRLGELSAADTIAHIGSGDIVTVAETSAAGRRAVGEDATGRATATYTDFPTYPVLYHQGGTDAREVAITFDDGPDPTWTPRVLDALKAAGVKATFFLVGSRAENYPRLVKRIAAEGHLIGNHTYTHPNPAEIVMPQLRLELNATTRLIESITGHSTTLFRPPYNADARPAEVGELAPLALAQDGLGYLVVLERIDPQDWARPGAEEILRRVKEQRREGNIILLHDGGGNRAQTCAALPQIIDWLRTRGDRIVPLSELVGISDADLMPPVPSGDSTLCAVAGTGFQIWHAVEDGGWAFMIAATALVIARTLLVAALAARHHRRHAPGPPPADLPLSAVVAAYNEGKVIAGTLRALLDTDYPGPVEIIVVDDGSTDDTAAQAAAAAAADARVRLFRQPNRGKAAALAAGVARARHEALVFLDADTHFERATLRHLAAPLADARVGAVSGHPRVGNPHTFVARCQALEYICGFNLDRRAYASWNCITVVPGAVSAARKSALAAAGGFTADTLAEDTDLTLALHRGGWIIAYAPDAIGWTEAPETARALARQRCRWAFGTLQCLWKHRDLVFNRRFGALGWFSLPSIWFFQIILVAVAPAVDLALLFSLVTRGGGTLWAYYAAFLAADLALAVLACRMEGEPLRKAWTILPMRLFYRPLLAWVIWRAILRALKGAWVTWGKLERTASVPLRTA